MDKKNLSLRILLGIVILVCLVVGAERVFPSLFHRGNYCRSIEELNQEITEHLQKGNSTFSIYVEGIDEEELREINTSMDGFFGHVNSFTIIRKLNSKVYHVSLDLEVSDNFYAYQKIAHNMDISAHPDAVKLAGHVQSILEQYKSLDDYEKVVAFHDYIVLNCEYGFLEEEDPNLSYTATGCLMHGTCVCNGYAEALELLLLCSGIDARMVVGTADNINHAWVMVKLYGDWYHIDPTWDDPVPDKKGTAIHVYLNVTDDILDDTHIWNREAYPECNSMDANYYMRSGSGFDNFNNFKQYVIDQMNSTDKVEVMVSNANQVDYDCGFVLHESSAKKVAWQTFGEGDYQVFLIRKD